MPHGTGTTWGGVPARAGGPGDRAGVVRALRGLPLRTKVAVTVVGAAVTLLILSTNLSLRYWREEALAAAEQQALLTARLARAGVESALIHGERAQARRNLTKLKAETSGGSVVAARLYGEDGTIVLSAEPGEEGRRTVGVWVPEREEIPTGGVVRGSPDGSEVRAFLPVSAPGVAVLEIGFSVEPLKAAMERGARLGLWLLIGSLVALAVILFLMIEREVVAPVQRVDELLTGAAGGRSRRADELTRIEASVTRLLDEEREAERRAAEHRRQLAETAGLAQVGQLAAEMAHEFKRPLASIQTALQLIRQEYVVDDSQERLFSAVEGQLERLSETMRDLFSLARPVEIDADVLAIHDLLDGALAQLAGHPAMAGVRVVRDYDPAIGAIHGDGRRLEQAVLNVMQNAAEAMPDGGLLTVRTRAAGPGWMELEFTDTGVGIPPDKLDQVTLPFYSTKAQGTGLGLSLVGRIVAAHGGRLTLESQPGAGTVVRIHLPTQGGTESAKGEERCREHESSYSTTTTSSEA